MPRPKGSKNKKKLLAGANIEELIAQRSEAKAVLEAERDEQAAVVAEETAKLKSIKAEIKKIIVLEEQKVAAEAAKEAVQSKI